MQIELTKLLEQAKKINHIFSKFPLQMQKEIEPNKIF